jgi:hypothetical protein
MPYTPLISPENLDFQKMTKEQAIVFLEWFIGKIPERILILSEFIRSFDKFNLWEGDLSSNSLDSLGVWMCENIKPRKRTFEEVQSIKLLSPKLFEVVPIINDITPESYSYNFDVGMYFGQSLIYNNSKLFWAMVYKPKNNTDLHQPLITMNNKVFLNPIRIISNYSFGIVDKAQGPDKLRESYDLWERILKD